MRLSNTCSRASAVSRNAFADRREFYNESVNINNVRVEQVPDVLIASFFRFKTFDLLRFSDAEKKDVDYQEAVFMTRSFTVPFHQLRHEPGNENAGSQT